MALKLFEFLEQFMINTFLIKLTQFDKTRSIINFFLFRWEILILNFTFETRNRTRFLLPLHFCSSIVEFALFLTKGINSTKKEIKNQTAKK